MRNGELLKNRIANKMGAAKIPSEFAVAERDRENERERNGRKKTARNSEYRMGRKKKVYRFSAESASDCRKIWKIIATSRRANEILVVRVAKRSTRMQLFHVRRDRCGYRTSTRTTTEVCASNQESFDSIIPGIGKCGSIRREETFNWRCHVRRNFGRIIKIIFTLNLKNMWAMYIFFL